MNGGRVRAMRHDKESATMSAMTPVPVSPPRVSVLLLVRNEVRYLRATLESILAQDFADFELLIGDNASDDGSETVIEELAARDGRIRIIRHVQNVGSMENLARLMDEARGRYVAWAAGHDIWSSNFLSSLVGALDKDSSAVTAYAPTEWIDAEGHPADSPKIGLIDTSGRKVVSRFNMVMWAEQYALYGLHRAAALRRTRMRLHVIAPGCILLGELAIQGSFVVVPEARWFGRINRGKETHQQRLERSLRMLFPNRRWPVLPHWHLPVAYLTSVLRHRTSFLVKGQLILSAMSSVILYGPSMAWDFVWLWHRAARRTKQVLTRARKAGGRRAPTTREGDSVPVRTKPCVESQAS